MNAPITIDNSSHSCIMSVVKEIKKSPMYVCICNQVTDKHIHAAVENGHTSLSGMCNALKVAECCGRCKDCAREVFDQAIDRIQPASQAA